MLDRPRIAPDPHRIAVLRIRSVIRPNMRAVFMQSRPCLVVNHHHLRLLEGTPFGLVVYSVKQTETRIVARIGMPKVVRRVLSVVTAAGNFQQTGNVVVQLGGEIAAHRYLRSRSDVLVGRDVPLHPGGLRAYPPIGIRNPRLAAAVAAFQDADAIPILIVVVATIPAKNKRSVPLRFVRKRSARVPQHDSRHSRSSHYKRPT